jgi:hypothetical protein
VFLAGSRQFTRRFSANRLGFSLRPLQFCLRALKRFMRRDQILPCLLALSVGTLEILSRLLAIAMGTQQFLLRALMITLRPLQIFLRPLALAVRTQEIVVRSLAVRLRALAIRLCSFEVCLCALQIGLRALQIGVCAFAFRVGSFEIRLHASTFGFNRVFQFTACLGRRVRGGLFGLGPGARHGLSEGAFDVCSRRRYF